MKLKEIDIKSLKRLTLFNMSGLARLRALEHLDNAENAEKTHYDLIMQKKLERKTMGEISRQKAREESQSRPFDYYHYTRGLKEIYINYDKRKKLYFIQTKNEEKYEERNLRKYAKNFTEAIELFDKEIQKETGLF